MYTITSTAGLNAAFARPFQAYAILYGHLAEHGPRGPVGWAATDPHGPTLRGHLQLGEHPTRTEEFIAEAAEQLTAALLWSAARAEDAAAGCAGPDRCGD